MDESINDNQTKNTIDANSASPNIKSSTDEPTATEQEAKLDGKNMMMLLIPKKNKQEEKEYGKIKNT